MGFLQRFLGLELVERPVVTLTSPIDLAIDRIIHARENPRSGNWQNRIPSVSQALSVPSIHRAVVLISSTTGMLSMQAFRNGSVMDDPPRLVVRPDPDEAPGTFYQQTAANLAKYGEYVWWIASRDGDGNASALVNVPLHELKVEPNPDDRRRSRYRWGSTNSTRWTPTNPDGQFVHRKYALAAPFDLRGEGPLQMAKAATSIAVEAQTWAANFYEGGKPRDIVKWARELDPTPRDDMGELNLETGLSEAERLKAQYIARDSNTPIVIDDRIDSITHPAIDEQTAHLLNARKEIRGDAALMFGIAGHFVEYVQSGTSLTYQTLETAFTELVRVCLQPLYLEPIEQDMSDLLPRTTTGRFNVRGFLRADVKTRFEVHGIAIPLGIYDAAYAQREEGIAPGDVEFAPIPFAPPQATPGPIRQMSGAVRCPKGHLLAELASAPYRFTCPKSDCKAVVVAA